MISVLGSMRLSLHRWFVLLPQSAVSVTQAIAQIVLGGMLSPPPRRMPVRQLPARARVASRLPLRASSAE